MSYEEQYRLSLFINPIREHLLNKGFFEHHLYSTIPYKIEKTDCFKVKKGLYLRYNPEPDIWQVGFQHDNFFWIGSMFRDEKRVSQLHRNEFTVVDIYQAQGSMASVVGRFIEILEVLEQKLELTSISKLNVEYITYSEFADGHHDKSEGNHWLVVTDYPTEESFYDAKGIDEKHTQKFEIFFIENGKPTEIAACGKLGPNLNKRNFIKDGGGFLEASLDQKNFTGFGFGLERLIQIYDRLRSDDWTVKGF